MKLIRHVYLVLGFIPCLLLLSLDTAYSQQPRPLSYVFVEVRDVTGELVNDATVTVSDPAGTEVRGNRIDKDGIAQLELLTWGRNYQNYTLQVSKSGYLTSERVLFFYPSEDSRSSYYGREDLPGSAEDFKASKPPPIKIALLRPPLTMTERQAVEVEERQQQLLRAAKRGDAVSLRKLLQIGAQADATDAKGASAIAWAAFSGDTESIAVLLASGADVRNKGKLGHQSLLIYLAVGILRANQTRSETDSRAGCEETVRRLIRAGAGVNVQNPYLGTVLNRAIPHTGSYLSLETIKLLIAAGADVNSADTAGQTPLMLAAEWSSADLSKTLLAAGAVASVNAKDKQGNTALMYTPRYSKSHAEVAKLLIAAGADVNAVNEDKQTALMLATQRGSIEIVKELLASKASITAKDKNGQTALMHASQISSSAITKLLIQAGASINEKDAQGWTALMRAAPRYYNDSGSDVVQVLIAAGATVNDVNEDGQTPLMLASRWYDEWSVKLLLAAGASINAKDKQGQTALMHACQAFAPINLELFVKSGAGASVNEKDARGWTALMYAVPRYYVSKDAGVLIAAGANVNAVNDDGQTALMLAAQTGSIEIVQLLLEKGAARSINAKDKQGRTALMYVKPRYPFESVLEVTKALIAAGADVNAADDGGTTPLMALPGRVETDRELTIKALLQAGASINAQDNQGRTALILAAHDPNYFETLTVLIKAGANPNVADNEGRTALMVAAAVGGTYEIGNSQLLLTAGAKTNLVDRKGRTALTIAKEAGKLMIVKLLEEAEARH